MSVFFSGDTSPFDYWILKILPWRSTEDLGLKDTSSNRENTNPSRHGVKRIFNNKYIVVEAVQDVARNAFIYIYIYI